MMERIGVFLCSGCEIGTSLDLGALESVAGEEGAAFVERVPALCEPAGLEVLQDRLGTDGIGGAVLAACSQRCRADVLSETALGVPVERAALREQVVWSHPPGDEDTQALAEDLVRMALARARTVRPPEVLREPVEDAVLVVGGGLAGMEAALAASAMGKEVILVEAADRLGGFLRDVAELPPERPPWDVPVPNTLHETIRKVEEDPRIRVFTGASLRRISGQPGQFAVELTRGREETSFRVGAIVQATGARPYDAARLERLGGGRLPDVITPVELEAMLVSGRLERPSDGTKPRRVVFVQCAGSRDREHLPYCSTECCATTLRQAARIRRDHPEVEPVVVARDLRTPGTLEHLFQAVQEEGGTLFLRGEVDAVSPGENGSLQVRLGTSLLGDGVALPADLVVLAVGMVPHSADGEAIRELLDAMDRAEHGETETQRAEAREVVERLKIHEGTEILHLAYRQGPDLPVLQYGFPDSHYICFPYETRRTGIYAAGTVRAPMGPAQAVEDAWGAALKAVQCIEAARRGEAVHPRSGDVGVPEFFLQRCTQCKRCTEECPFGTLDEDDKGTPQLNPLRCRHCGICMGACPERIVSFPDYSVDGVASMIKALEVPDEDEEKPRIVALLCENDALPALDAAAALRRSWNPWVRVIPVRCLGSVNIVWIADALSRGIDGVILVGCRYGEDTQCHYIRGSELANRRLENVQETLERLSLEPERIRVVELAHNEFHRVPAILDEFAEEIGEMDPNPYKGF